MNKQEYAEYLQSEHWKKRRSAWKSQERNSKCWICGSSDFLNTHHRRYERSGKSVLFKEKDNHLSTLCRECHVLWHRYFPINRIFKRSVAARIIALIQSCNLTKEEAFRVAADSSLYKTYSEQITLWKEKHLNEIKQTFKNPKRRPNLDDLRCN